jgi:hypothetical protein
MAAASAGEYCGLLVTGLRCVPADQDFVSPQTGRAWVKHGQALQHFFHYVFRPVDDFFHDEANVQLLTGSTELPGRQTPS